MSRCRLTWAEIVGRGVVKHLGINRQKCVHGLKPGGGGFSKIRYPDENPPEPKLKKGAFGGGGGLRGVFCCAGRIIHGKGTAGPLAPLADPK